MLLRMISRQAKAALGGEVGWTVKSEKEVYRGEPLSSLSIEEYGCVLERRNQSDDAHENDLV